MRISGKIIVTGIAIVLVVLAIWGWLSAAGNTQQSGSWDGVDVNVIEKFAAEAGREAHAPLINTDQGDLLLFVFALGGAVAGFIAGYCWRTLISERVKG